MYSSPRLVVDRIEELIAELLLVENVWCQKQSWSFMNLLCSGMVGFGLRRNLGTTEKEHPSPTLPPPKVGEVLAFYQLDCKQTVPVTFTDEETQYPKVNPIQSNPIVLCLDSLIYT